MFQLMYNDDFTEVIRDIPHWKTKDDIPSHIIEFMKELDDLKSIYEETQDKHYCSHCMADINENLYCNKCKLQYENLSKEKNKHSYTINDINESTYLNDTVYCYVFDIVQNHVFLYLLCKETKVYYDGYRKKVYKNYDFKIRDAFFIEENQFTYLNKNIVCTFKEYNDNVNNFDFYDKYPDGTEAYKKYNELFGIGNYMKTHLYTNNLDELRNTIYRYSFIWKAKDYLLSNFVRIENIVFMPLCFPQFEYLIKFKLFSLGFNNADMFKKGSNFKEIFGIDKQYLSLMAANDISRWDLLILQVYPTTDIELIKFFSTFLFCESEIKDIFEKYNINLHNLRDYLISTNLDQEHFSEYFDYIKMASELNLDLKSKRVIYPKNLREAHDSLYQQIKIVNDPIIDKKIHALAHILSINNYDDGTYLIYPVNSMPDLIDEGKQQKNCVYTYGNMIANNECQIYFMRRKEAINKSFVTIEVRNNEIVQARLKYNELPSKEINKVLENWESNLIRIDYHN